MSYQPFLISNFKTGLEKDLQPWLIAEDAQEELLDGYIEHGVIHRREGYNFYADGGKGDEPYCESRIVKTITISGASITGAIDDVNRTYTIDTSSVVDPVRRGGFRVIGSNPAQIISDDGEGGTNAASDGTINTALTNVSYYNFPDSIEVTFTTAPATGSTVTVEVDYHPGNPVMMVANFVTATDTRQLLVADTRRINRYNITTNRFDDITTTEYLGTSHDFFTWTQYPTISDGRRMIFTNNVDQMQSYDGTNIADFYPTITAASASTENATGDGTPGPYTHTTSNTPVAPTTVVIVADPGGTPQTVTDDGAGNLTGDGTGTINYTTGAISVTFTANVPAAASNIDIDYDYATEYVVTCLKVLNYKDRLILFRTTETGGVVYPQRIRISGTGQSGDQFITTASGAGVIDIPDGEWIMGVEFNRDDVLIFTRKSHWILKYTGNDIVPFSLDRIDNSRGNAAPFAPISYLNLTKAYSPQGFTITDGYQVNRYDERIPDYSFEDIDSENFDLCFSGVIDDDKSHYLIHPSPEQETSDLILVNNYEENSFSVYRLPLSCMGLYKVSFDITWDDLTIYDSWEELAGEYNSWRDMSFSEDQPIAIGGGHKGEIWQLNLEEGQDNPLNVWAIVEDSSEPLVVQVTSDWHNYQEGDYIFFSGLGGATELNNKQGFIPSGGIVDNYNFLVQFEAENPREFTAFTSGGKVSRTIPFEFTTKNFNPYAKDGMKVRCGWLYLYFEATQNIATDREGNNKDPIIYIDVYADDSEYPTQVATLNLGYQGNVSNFDGRISLKVWRKVFINQTARMLQFSLRNADPGADIRVHAIMPGFSPAGRLM